MKLFNSIAKKADLLEEMARRSKFEDFFQTYRLKKEIEDKKLGVARPLVFEFILNFLKDKGMVPEDRKFQGSRYAAEVGEFLKGLIDSGVVKPEIKDEFDQYLSDNLGEFVRVKQQLRTRGKGEMVGKTFGSKEEFEKYGQVKSKEEFQQALQARKEEQKQQRTADEGKIGIAELKIKMMGKLDNPRIRQGLVDSLLDTETDSVDEAETKADQALSMVGDAFQKANNINDVLDNLEKIQSTGTAVEADLAEAAFNYLKKIVTVEDEESSKPTSVKTDKNVDQDIADLATPDTKERAVSVYGTDHYVETFEKVKTSSKGVLLETTRQKFKPKNIHQLIQRQYDLR